MTRYREVNIYMRMCVFLMKLGKHYVNYYLSRNYILCEIAIKINLYGKMATKGGKLSKKSAPDNTGAIGIVRSGERKRERERYIIPDGKSTSVLAPLILY